jgi:hypothetical protein
MQRAQHGDCPAALLLRDLDDITAFRVVCF